MNTAKWFDRKFEFNLSGNDNTVVIKRLQEATGKLKQIIADKSFQSNIQHSYCFLQHFGEASADSHNFAH